LILVPTVIIRYKNVYVQIEDNLAMPDMIDNADLAKWMMSHAIRGTKTKKQNP